MFSPDCCVGIHQTPPALIKKPDDMVQLVCTHNLTEYRVMLWYQQPAGQTDMKCIGYINYRDVTVEETYKQNFEISGDLSTSDIKNVSLIIQLTVQCTIVQLVLHGDTKSFWYLQKPQSTGYKC